MNMMKFLILILLLISAVCFADLGDPAAIETAKLEIRVKVDEFPAKVKALDKKTYSGTFSQIMADRFVDVNEVAVEAKSIVDKAQEICEAQGIKADRQKALSEVLIKGTKKDQFETKKVVTEITKVISEGIDMLDPDDPNYIFDIEMNSCIIAWLLELDKELP